MAARAEQVPASVRVADLALIKGNNLTPWAVLATLALGLAFFAVAVWGTPPNQGIIDQAAALLLITSAAIAIERLLEVCWTHVDATRGAFWPLSEVDQHITALADEIADTTKGPLTQLAAATHQIQEGKDWTAAQAQSVRDRLDEVRVQIARFQALAPTNQRGQLVASTAKAAVTAIANDYDKLKPYTDVAKDAIDSVTGFIDGVKQNPGRRIISIYLGVAIGLGVAFVLGLDVFAATSTTAAGTVAEASKLGVAMTGVVIGLGSAPTHELIKALEKLKKPS